MSSINVVSDIQLNIFQNKSRLWWFGLLIFEFGVIFWIIALNSHIAIPLLNLLTEMSVLELSQTGILTAQFLFALAGAVMAGWGISIMAIATQYTSTQRVYLITSLLVWFGMDSLASSITGYGINAILNIAFFLLGIYVAYTNPINENEVQDHI